MTDKILIVGGGISGLVLAAYLREHGQSPEIVEKTRSWTPKGAGIHLYSNATRALDQIGVAREIAETGSGQDNYDYADPGDQFPVRVTYPRLAGPDFSALITISRQALHEILVRKVKSLDIPIRLGETVDAIEQDDGQVDVTFSTGDRDSYRLLVGCDGIYSQIRNQIFGKLDPEYTGQAIWRATLERHPESEVPKIMYAGGGKMFGVVPMSEETIYLLAGMPDPEKPHYPEAQFVDLVKEHFAEFGGLAPFYLEQLTDPTQLAYTAIELVNQPAPWHRGRIFLIGDAAHASPPYLAQGAAMAIEDSIVLGELISGGLTLAETQSGYMERRLDRASFIQSLSVQRNKERYQGGSYSAPPGEKSERVVYLENNAQRQIDELYTRLANPI